MSQAREGGGRAGKNSVRQSVPAGHLSLFRQIPFLCIPELVVDFKDDIIPGTVAQINTADSTGPTWISC